MTLVDFGISAGLLMFVGLAIVRFFIWIDSENKPN
jgi:hypothetical protein